MKKTILALSFSLGFSSFAPLAYADSKTVEGAKEDLQDFKRTLKKKLGKIDEELKELGEKAKSKKDDVSEETVAELKKARGKVKNEIDDLKDDSKDSWKKTKKAIADSVDSLAAKIRAALD